MKKNVKKSISMLMASMLALSTMSQVAFAQTDATTDMPEIQVLEQELSDGSDVIQLDFDETMSAIFDELNKLNTSIEQLGTQEYIIPINGYDVNVTVTNEEAVQSRGIGTNNNYVKGNTSYVFTLKITNMYNGSGSLTYVIDYNTGSESDYSDNQYRLTVTNLDLIPVAPNGYVVSSYTSGRIDNNNMPSVTMTAYASFRNALMSSIMKDMYIEVSLASFGTGLVRALYIYNEL